MSYPALTTIAIVLLLLAFALAVALARQRSIAVEAQGELAAFVDEERHLVRSRLPALVESLTNPAVVVPGPLRTGGADPHAAVVTAAGQLAERARKEAIQEAEAVTRSVMRSAQNLASEQQVLISAMQDRYDEPAVLQDLLGLDHANSQLGRTLQSVAVLCGSWPGQQRSVAPVMDVVRGAIGRIRDYTRVQICFSSEISVVSQAVEPVVLALAALLDNATRYSQPGSIVQVSAQYGHNGHAIIIDDAGVGMTSEAVRRAHWLLEGRTGQNFAVVGAPPQIGFAVIGVLAARYGFRVSVDTLSPFGGVRAVLFLPNNLLTRAARPQPTAPPAPQPTPRPALDDVAAMPAPALRDRTTAEDRPEMATSDPWDTPQDSIAARSAEPAEGQPVGPGMDAAPPVREPHLGPMSTVIGTLGGATAGASGGSAAASLGGSPELSPADDLPATTANGLPRRRRRSSPTPDSSSPRIEFDARQPADPTEAGRRSVAAAIAWQRGTRQGRTNESTEKESS